MVISRNDKTVQRSILQLDGIKNELAKMCGTDSAFCDIVLNLLEHEPEKRKLTRWTINSL